MKYTRTSWDGFPKVKVLYPLNTLKRSDEDSYLKAKKGDVYAAMKLLKALIKIDEKIHELRPITEEFNPILVPVLAQEHLGKNKIPAVFATIMGAELSLKVCDDIVQSVKANHTDASAYERLVRQPRFDGNVDENRNYIILDDTVAMGGTLAALKGHIESNGGKVILAVTLTGFSTPEFDMVPNTKTLDHVLNKHPELSEWWKNEFGFPLEFLTQQELGHFKKPDSLDTIRSRLIEAGFQSSNEIGS